MNPSNDSSTSKPSARTPRGDASQTLAYGPWAAGDVDLLDAVESFIGQRRLGEARAILDAGQQAVVAGRAWGTLARSLRLRAALSRAEGNLAAAQDDVDRALDLHRRGASGKLEEGLALREAARVAAMRRDWLGAEDLLGRALSKLDAAGARLARVGAMGELARISMALGDLERALDLARESLDEARALGNEDAKATAWFDLGTAALLRGDVLRAMGDFQMAAETSGDGSELLRARAIAIRGALALGLGDDETARRSRMASQAWLARSRPSRASAWIVALVALHDAADDSEQRAATRLGAARATLAAARPNEAGALDVLVLIADVLHTRTRPETGTKPSSLRRLALQATAALRATAGDVEAQALIGVALLLLPDAAALRAMAVRLPDGRRAGPSIAWDGGVVVVDGWHRVDLRRRHVFTRMFDALVRAHEASPPHRVSTEALASAAWPGYLPRVNVLAQRVQAAVYGLRELGLREVIDTREEGYGFAPGTRLTAPG